MNFRKYSEKVSERFEKMTDEKIGNHDVSIAYESIFKLKWSATKLKKFSFVAHVERIDEDTLKTYTDECFEYSRKNYKGLPRGIQNAFVTFAVLASENIDKSAITFVESRPKKHFAALEIPIIIDLKNEKLKFYAQNHLWGGMYYKFLRKYIFENFSCR